MIDTSCIESIIGLSTSDCPCLDVAGSVDPKESLSGQYIDNLEHGISLQALASLDDCGTGSIWDLMVQARKEGADDLITQFMIAANKYNTPKLNNYQGFFGERNKKKGNSRITNLKRITGFSFCPTGKAKGLNANISSIGLGISLPGTYDVYIMCCETHNILHELEVTVTGKYGEVTEFENPISLPLSDKKGIPKSYIFAYDRGQASPMNYKFHCGCNDQAPQNWEKDGYITANGFNEDDFIDINCYSCSSKFSNGLVVCFDLSCDMFGWMCDVKESFWCDTEFGRIFSKVLVMMSNVKLASAIVKSENINFYTLLSHDDLCNTRNKLAKLSSELIDLLATEYLPEQMSNCLTCNPNSSLGFQKQEILV